MSNGRDQRLALSLAATLFFALSFCAEAQQSKRPRIGYLTVSSLSANVARIEAFRQGLRELGYAEGKNLIIEWRTAEGKPQRRSELVAELVRLKVDVLVTSGPTMTRAAQEATRTIPVVMAQDTDPVGNGFVATLARPGGNITGLSTLSPELSGKQLELLKEIIPRLSRLAVLANSSEPANSKTLKEIELAAAGLGVKTQALDVLRSTDVQTAFRAASHAHTDAFLVLASAILTDHRTEIAKLAIIDRVPTMCFSGVYVEAER